MNRPADGRTASYVAWKSGFAHPDNHAVKLGR